MGILTRLFGKKEDTDDSMYGTGLWRQHRDRFNRAVDRYYETALALHRESPETAGPLIELTETLKGLAAQCDELTANLHSRVPVKGIVVPAQVRAAVGDSAELISRAAGKVAEAAQIAAMHRARTRAAPRTSAAGATDSELRETQTTAANAGRFVEDARTILDTVSSRLQEMDA